MNHGKSRLPSSALSFFNGNDRSEVSSLRVTSLCEESYVMEFKCVFKKSFGRTEKVRPPPATSSQHPVNVRDSVII